MLGHRATKWITQKVTTWENHVLLARRRRVSRRRQNQAQISDTSALPRILWCFRQGGGWERQWWWPCDLVPCVLWLSALYLLLPFLRRTISWVLLVPSGDVAYWLRAEAWIWGLNWEMPLVDLKASGVNLFENCFLIWTVGTVHPYGHSDGHESIIIVPVTGTAATYWAKLPPGFMLSGIWKQPPCSVQSWSLTQAKWHCSGLCPRGQKRTEEEVT